MRSLIARLASVVLVSLALVGCGGSPPASPLPIEGTTWRAVSVGGQPSPPAFTPTVSFAEGKIHGTTGCNSYSGDVRIEAGRITISDLAMTAAMCVDPSGQAVEKRFVSALTAARSIGADPGGRIVIDGPGGKLILER